jgi:plastocyanin
MVPRNNNWRINAIAMFGCAMPALAVVGCESHANLGPVADARSVADIRTALAGSAQAATAGTGGTAAAATGTGWGTIKGRFVFDGTPPKMAPYAVTKDQATCAPGGHTPLQETLVVDSGTGGIKYIAVFLREASRVHESAQPKGGDVLFDQKSCVFLTHVIGASVGQTLDIKNSDDVGHNTNIVGKKNTFNQTIPAGQSIPFKLQKEEATPAAVTCSIHPWMSAYLLPRANGYFAVTAADGSFEIKNVPAGEKLEFQVWHESAAGAGGALVLTTPEAKALEWSNKGRFSVTLQPDEVKEIKVTVPASSFRG